MTEKEASAAAEIANAMSECMNLLFLFAAPRVLDSVRGSGTGGFAGLDGPAALASLRRFLRHASGIRARAQAVTGDIERLVQAAMIVEEIAGTLSAGHVTSQPLPVSVVERARRALAILGVSEPRGGWETFEGFTVPYPPPSPRR